MLFSYLWLKSRLLISWKVLDITHSLPLFTCDHMTSHMEVHDQNYINLHVTVACDVGHMDMIHDCEPPHDLIMTRLHIYATQNLPIVTKLITMQPFNNIMVWQNLDFWYKQNLPMEMVFVYFCFVHLTLFICRCQTRVVHHYDTINVRWVRR